MIKMKNSLIFIITAILYFSCTKDTENELDVVQTKHESFIYKNPVIKLKTYRLSYNMLSEDIEKYMAILLYKESLSLSMGKRLQ